MDRIWYDSDRVNFFAIPDDVELPSGGYLIRSLSAPSQKVDPDAVADYRISREEATDRLGAGIDDAWGSLVGAVDSLISKARPATNDADSEDEDAPSPSGIPRHLEDVLGMKPGAILTEPEQIRARLRSAASSIGVKIKVGDEARAEQEGPDGFQADAAPEPAPAEADEAPPEPDPLRDFFSRPEVTGAIAGLGRALSKIGGQLQDAAEKGDRSRKE